MCYGIDSADMCYAVNTVNLWYVLCIKIRRAVPNVIDAVGHIIMLYSIQNMQHPDNIIQVKSQRFIHSKSNTREILMIISGFFEHFL